MPKTFRLFISSTFSDLKDERDLPQQRVYSKAKAYCQQHGFSFQPIDLRWGVSEEAGSDQKTMQICLDEVRRCKDALKPHFAIILGDRYGWVPLPYSIEQSEFETLEPKANAVEKKLLAAWYKLDTNRISAAYVLQPKYGTDRDTWSQIEDTLRTFLQTHGKDERYFDSATEQEIEEGLFHNDAICKNSIALFSREPKQIEDNPEKLEKLIDHIRSEIPEANSHVFKRGNPGSILVPFETWLMSAIKQEIEAYQSVPAETIEQQEQESFLKGRTQLFVGRVQELKRIHDYLSCEESKHPLMIYGNSGSGKSALMAEAIRQRGQSPSLLYRFMGATTGSGSLLNVLRWLRQELERLAPTLQTPAMQQEGFDLQAVLTDESKLCNLTKELLENLPEDKPLTLFLDALDQYTTPDRLLWLPTTLPSHVRIVLSVLPGYTPSYEMLKQKLPEENQIEVLGFSGDEAKEVLDLWLKEKKRTLDETQKSALLECFAASNEHSALYLKILLEESLEWKSYEPIELSDYPKDLEELIGTLFEKLHTKHHHPKEVVTKALAYLAAARDGLSEQEIFGILSDDPAVMQCVANPYYESPTALPASIWARLYAQIAHYLTVKNTDGIDQISFFHRRFQESALMLLDNPHKPLADYYAKRFKEEKEQLVKQENFHYKHYSISIFVELAYQLIKSGQYVQALITLCDFEYLMIGMAHGRLELLLETYDLMAQAQTSEGYKNHKAQNPKPYEKVERHFKICQDFLRANKHLLATEIPEGIDWGMEKIFFQLAIEHADNSPLTQGAEKALEEDRIRWQYLRNNQRPKEVRISGLLAVMEGHEGGVKGVLELSDERILSWSNNKNTIRLWDSRGALLWKKEGRVIDDGRILTQADDGTLYVWNVEKGVSRKIGRHTESIKGAKSFSDGYIFTWFDDGTLYLWDVEKGVSRKIGRHAGLMAGAQPLSSGRILTWSSRQSTAYLWGDMQEGPINMDCDGLVRGVRAMHVLNSGLIVSLSAGGVIRLWNKDGRSSIRIGGDSSFFKQVQPLADGRILAHSEDQTLSLWDANGGTSISPQIKHTGSIDSIRLLPDNQITVWNDTSLYLWHTEDGVLKKVGGHENTISGVDCSHGDNFLSWTVDGDIYLWSKDGALLHTVAGEGRQVVGALALSGGQILSWSSGLPKWSFLNTVLHLWDNTGETRDFPKKHELEVEGIQLLPSSQTLAWSKSGTLHFLDHNGIELQAIEKYGSNVASAHLFKDGRVLIWEYDKNRDASLQFWDSKDTEQNRPSKCIPTWDFRVLPDDRVFLYYGDNGSVVDSSGNQLTFINGGGPPINAEFLSHGRVVTWESCESDMWKADSRLQLWDENGNKIKLVRGHEDEILGVKPLSNGRFISWAKDKTVCVRDCNGEVLIAINSPELIDGAHQEENGEIVLWSQSNFYLWGKDGKILKTLHDTAQNRIQYPNLLYHKGGAAIFDNRFVMMLSNQMTAIIELKNNQATLWLSDAGLIPEGVCGGNLIGLNPIRSRVTSLSMCHGKNKLSLQNQQNDSPPVSVFV